MSVQLDLATIRALYHRSYYLADCEGHRQFRTSHGHRLSRRLTRCLGLLAAAPGMHVLDVGCGRGELALHLAARGCTSIALDPSPDALALLDSARSEWPDAVPLYRIRARGEALPLRSGWAHRVILSDVVEHLPRAAFRRLLGECHRVLAPGGRLVLHTQPNRLLVDWTVPLLSRISRLWGVALPRDLREEMTRGAGRDYHVNELTRGEVRRALRAAGLEIRELWLEGTYPLHRVFGESRLKDLLLPRFRRGRLLKELFASQIFAVAERNRGP